MGIYVSSVRYSIEMKMVWQIEMEALKTRASHRSKGIFSPRSWYFRCTS